MPQIVVTVNGPESRHGREVMRERIALADLESRQFTAHLVQRIEWALSDADSIESSETRAAGSSGASRERRARKVPGA